MHIINARLRNREGLHDLHLEHGRIASITAQTGVPTLMAGDLGRRRQPGDTALRRTPHPS